MAVLVYDQRSAAEMMMTKGTSPDILNDGLGEMQNPFPQLYHPRLDVFADFRVQAVSAFLGHDVVTGHDRVTIHQSTTMIHRQSICTCIYNHICHRPTKAAKCWLARKKKKHAEGSTLAVPKIRMDSRTAHLHDMQTGNHPSQIPENTAPEALIRRSAIYRMHRGKGSKMYPLLRVFSWKMCRIYIRRSPKGESGD
jgi:hypothetical protein